MATDAGTTLLKHLGERVRAARLERGWSQRELCSRAGLSARYLVQLEGGGANVSLGRLVGICHAFELSLVSLLSGLGPTEDAADRLAAAFGRLDPSRQAELLQQVGGAAPKVALIGLRGAGKSTVGRAAADQVGCSFIQLNDRVCERAGMSLAEIFEYHGAERYRELCVDSLREILAQPDGCILEVGGSVVLDPTAWDLLSHGSEVVWLYASPEAYLRRVVDQGDLRPMEGRHDALGELRAILAEREPLYARATHHLDTVDIGQVGATGAVVGLFSG